MKITSIDSNLLAEIEFSNAGRGPGDFDNDIVAVHRGYVDSLPDGTAAIVVTADLQGRETFASAAGRPLRLLGEVLPGMLQTDVLPHLGLPPGDIGVWLAGDFYTVPALDKRGGSGDVRPVWNAFAAAFDWVVGVAGNHDTFENGANRPRWTSPVHFLDNDQVTIGGVTIAGLSGIPGNPKRRLRRTEDDYAETLRMLLRDEPAITLLHDGPDVPKSGFRGLPRIREIFERSAHTLVVRGHSHWPEPLAELACGTQVLNVDARVVILTESSRSPRPS
ncbi:metallophosphoesterase [Novipirellula caenicola]|uniref:Calcineurin-like phosphoesterase domain-containing protein n=1 Tax=Novipirellula caenicola TaxID=1536901 RepID=A0ABP9VVA2_9BACT